MSLFISVLFLWLLYVFPIINVNLVPEMWSCSSKFVLLLFKQIAFLIKKKKKAFWGGGLIWSVLSGYPPDSRIIPAQQPRGLGLSSSHGGWQL